MSIFGVTNSIAQLCEMCFGAVCMEYVCFNADESSPFRRSAFRFDSSECDKIHTCKIGRYFMIGDEDAFNEIREQWRKEAHGRRSLGAQMKLLTGVKCALVAIAC